MPRGGHHARVREPIAVLQLSIPARLVMRCIDEARSNGSMTTLGCCMWTVVRAFDAINEQGPGFDLIRPVPGRIPNVHASRACCFATCHACRCAGVLPESDDVHGGAAEHAHAHGDQVPAHRHTHDEPQPLPASPVQVGRDTRRVGVFGALLPTHIADDMDGPDSHQSANCFSWSRVVDVEGPASRTGCPARGPS